MPDGWEPAGEDTPDWAYGAIIYNGPDAGEYTPSIVALVSKPPGNVDPQQIIDLAPGELNNLPGWSAMNEGLEDQKEIIGAATDVIDTQTTITP